MPSPVSRRTHRHPSPVAGTTSAARLGVALAAVLVLTALLAAPASAGRLTRASTPRTAGQRATSGATSDTPPPALPGDPPYDVPQDKLAAALDCDPITHPQREPVLLVHGTFTTGHEEYDWSWAPNLRSRGFDVCIVTYPDRGLGDQQVSAEYIAYAVQTIHARTGKLVDMAGHSQGASMPRWAIRFWPSVQRDLDDFVLVAGPNHGTTASPDSGSPFGSLTSTFGMPAAFYQFSPDANFTKAVNTVDETPGKVSYTSLYSTFYDELVEPAAPVPTAGLDWGHEGRNTRNIAIQQVCPGRFVDHLAIGTTDPVAFDLAVDAFTHPGPADPARLATTVCLQPFLADPGQLSGFVSAFTNGTLASGFPNWHVTTSEPPLKPYAQAALDKAERTGK